MKRIFERKLYGRLLEWKNERKGKTAILVEGARRVGKSTIVEHFVRNEYKSYIIIDFNMASKRVLDLFEDLMDLNFIFMQLQAIYNVVLEDRNSAIVFDEVQKCPLARQAIKYLVADGRYDYIETGSLISIRKNTKDITIPSEEERVTMYPMDYEEFRWALNDKVSVTLLKQFFDQSLPLLHAHRLKMRELRLYMLVGGMPQAVNEYLDTNNLMKVDLVKRDIIRLYQDDFMKIDDSGRVSQMYMDIPAQLSRANNRYKTYTVLGQVQEDKLQEYLRELEESKTVLFSFHTNDPNVGMSLTKDSSKFKMYCADTGLFITLAFWEKDYTENTIYEKLLSDKLPVNLGYVYENLVAQMIASAGNKLFYYTWPKDETHYYEIDFLLSRGSKIQPVEVKSSGYKCHTSMDAFCKKFSKLVDRSYLIYTKDLQKEGSLTYLPFYMTPLL